VNSNYFAAAVARSRRVPVIVFPQGVYEPAIRRGLKGERVRRFAERAVLQSALAVHLSFESEIPLARALFDGVSTLVAPTGAVVPTAHWTGGAGYVAWFGRYEPRHKGLDYLLCAIHGLPPGSRPQVILRGYDFLGGKGRIVSMVRDLGLAKWVDVGPRIDGAEKTAFLQGADLYVHPSRWESHSVALIEALALGVPTVVSDRLRAASILRSYGAASVVPLTSRDMSRAIVASSNDRQLGRSGRKFVETYLSWPRVVAGFLHQLNALMTKRI
jgi:glycosyltransferase involved in cell wall biosynthesis